MNRRFLNLVLRCTGGRYSLHHLDTWRHLFYKSAAAAGAAGRKKKGIFEQEQGSSLGGIPVFQRLPAPSVIFQPSRSHHFHQTGTDMFAPFGSEGKVIFVDGVGHTTVYDTRFRSIHGMPMINGPKKRSPLVLSSNFNPIATGGHTESLYVMDMAPGKDDDPFSEVLSFSSKGWLWRPLAPPPFTGDPFYKSAGSDSCPAAVDGNTIYVSPSTKQWHTGTYSFNTGTHEWDVQLDSIGTYSFNTVTQEWHRVGDWVLPFHGNAEYVPEIGLWIGLSPRSPYHMCAVSSLEPPLVKYVWRDLDLPERWDQFKQALVYLGLGRFCTVKFFEAWDVPYNDDACNDVAVFTGVEVVGCDDQLGELKMITHKSKCLTGVVIQCVL